MVSLTVYGALAFVILATTKSRRARLLVLATAAALVLAVGVSRLYLGVHYVSDVLAAYGAGVAWLMLCGLTLVGASRLSLSAQIFRGTFLTRTLDPLRVTTRRELRRFV
jgi:membrane-associated phospholipid phosphatase